MSLPDGVVGEYRDAEANFDHVVRLEGQGYIISSYEYNADTETRTGRLLLLDRAVNKIFETKTPWGVLESRVRSHEEGKLWSICSDQELRLISVTPNGFSVDQAFKITNSERESGVIGVGMDLSNDSVGASLSDGSCLVLQGIGCERPSRREWNAHPGVEVWTIALKGDGDIVATGADDCIMKLWDLRQNQNKGPVAKSSHHQAGVTVCRFVSKNIGPELWTGSYDECLVGWDLRNIDTPIVELPLGGGIWRIEEDPELNDLMIALSHDGARIVHIQNCTEVSKKFKEPHDCHDSMIYGICKGTGDRYVSCSFYDGLVREWDPLILN